MTQLSLKKVRRSAGLAAAALLAACALPAHAQPSPTQPDVFEHDTNYAPPKPKNATSDLQATAPTPAEQRETRALAGAVFAKPAAAARAADKATAAATPDLNPPVQAKPEWAAKDGVQLGGKGLEIKSPF